MFISIASCSSSITTITETITTSFTTSITSTSTSTVILTDTIKVTTAKTTPVVLIADANLESAISDVFYMYDRPIFISDLETLITLEAPSENITDLRGLEYCIRLEILEIQNNNISDLAPLSSLPNLKILILSGNTISDISPLVDNSGIGVGDEIYLFNNRLDLQEKSEDMLNVEALQDRGVLVYY